MQISLQFDEILAPLQMPNMIVQNLGDTMKWNPDGLLIGEVREKEKKEKKNKAKNNNKKKNRKGKMCS